MNGNSLTYDAENRQTGVTSPTALGGGTESYAYDGEEQRVLKSGPGGATAYVCDALGRLITEYADTMPSGACTPCYLSDDHLGSVRVVSRHNYLPFGGEIPAGTAGRTSQFGATDNVSQRFTGKERDGESGIDYFKARYFGSALGRFTSPDPLGANLIRVLNPQWWNKYAYVANNPLAFTDLDGKDAVAVVFQPFAAGAGHAAVISIHRAGRLSDKKAALMSRLNMKT